MTEIGGAFQALPNEDPEKSRQFVGYLQDHMEAKVVDAHEKVVPFGTTGELWLRGYSVFNGYYKDQIKTKSSITENGWLRTG